MKWSVLILLVVAAGYLAFTQNPNLKLHHAGGIEAASRSDRALASAFRNHKHDVPVEGRGTVVRVLPDDTRGSRHQRFILRLDSGQTLLVAHNIDVAPRIPDLKDGDEVAFSGEYEWNPQGGIIHWTHRDPDGRHPAGWLRHDGRTYR